jgi:hypothetical protein
MILRMPFFSTPAKGLVTMKTGDSSGDDRAIISDKVISKLIVSN